MSQTSSSVSDDETERSFSDTERFKAPEEQARSAVSGTEGDSENGWELEWIESDRMTEDEESGTMVRQYRLKFKGYPEPEWQPDDNVDALELVRCYWENIGKGQTACIEAQQQLLKEIAERPDSDDSDDDDDFHRRLIKEGILKRHQKLPLQPRPTAPRTEKAASDLADSDSDSDSEDEDDDRAPLFIQLHTPSSLTSSPPSLTESSHIHYRPKNPEIRQLIKSTTLQLDLLKAAREHKAPESTQLAAYLGQRMTMRKLWQTSPFVKRIDHSSQYTFSPSNPQYAEQIERILGEIKGLNFEESEGRTRSKPKIKLRMKNGAKDRSTPSALDGRSSEWRAGFCSSTTPLHSPPTGAPAPQDLGMPDVCPDSHSRLGPSPSSSTPDTASLAAPHPPSTLPAQSDRPQGHVQRQDITGNRNASPALDVDERERLFIYTNPSLKRKFVPPIPAIPHSPSLSPRNILPLDRRYIKKLCFRNTLSARQSG